MKKVFFLIFFQIFCMAGFSQTFPVKKFGTFIPARADLDVRWNAPTNGLPQKLWLYRIQPGMFSPTVVSNFIALGAFTDNEKTDYGTNGVVFETADKSRRLEIYLTLGQIHYRDNDAENYTLTNLLDANVPDTNQVFQLATNLLLKFGVSFSDLAKKTNGAVRFSIGSGYMLFYPKDTKDTIISNTTSQRISFARGTDGMYFLGDKACDIKFGKHGEVATISVSSPTLEHYKSYPMPSKETIAKQLHEGKAIYARINDVNVNWQTVRKLTVNEVAACCYFDSQARSQWAYPLVVLEGTVDTGTTNFNVEIDCPIIDESK
jgi:hypothetical protein